jgi:hypothetical protein
MDEVDKPRIEIVGLVRRKLVFSKRPEMMVTEASGVGGEWRSGQGGEAEEGERREEMEQCCIS